jgi:tetratricopeptide (TPR) repeat protein
MTGYRVRAEGGTGPRLERALAQHLRGILHAHEGRYEEAEAAFLRAAEAEPKMAGSYVELGLVYACRGEYREMVEALKRAVKIGRGGVRVYLGGRPLGDIAGDAAAGAEDGRRGVLLPVTATAHLTEGRDVEAAVMLEQSLGKKSGDRPLVIALLALAYLLRGEKIEADGAGVRRVAAPTKGDASVG